MGKSFKDFVIQAVLNKVYKIYPIGLPRVYLSTLLCLMRVRSEQDNICFIVLSSSLSLSLSIQPPATFVLQLSEISDSQWLTGSQWLSCWTTLRNHQLLLCIVHGPPVITVSALQGHMVGWWGADFSPQVLLLIKQSYITNQHKQSIQLLWSEPFLF